MDREHLGSLLFLSSLAASAAACAGGGEGPAPRPSPFATVGGDDGDGSGDPWTDPLETSGAPDPKGSDDGDETEGWPNEGETGSPSEGTGGPSDPVPGDTGATGTGSTSDSAGDYGEDSTGYYEPPAGGDPCPALAQLYADCVPEYTYENEIQLCDQSTASAQAISGACGLAHAEYLACLSTLDCGPLLQPGVPFACVIHGAATDLAC